MAQDQNLEEILIARNNQSGEIGAVTGLNEDGSPRMTDVKSAKLSDLVKFSKGQNPIEAFLSNFVRQYQNPSTFGFFRVPADRYDTVGTVISDLAKDPVANADVLKNNVVKLPGVKQKSEQSQQAKQMSSENEVKHSAIDEGKIDWAALKEKWGIDRDELEKSGDLKEMLYNRKSKLVTITPTFGGEKFPIDARLSFRTDADGNIKIVPHFIHREPKLDQTFEGYEFSKEDKANLRETGNLGKVVELTDKNGNKVPSYVSIDRLTNEVVSVPAKDIFIRETIGQTKLTIAEIMQLKEGKALPPKEISDKNGKTYKVVLQVSADRKGVEFVPGAARRMEQKEQYQQSKSPQRSSWLTSDGQIKPISKWAGVPMTPQQQADYVAGKVVEMTNMVDMNGKHCTVYLQFNPNKQRPTTSLNDPRVKIAEESKTQKAVNNDGLTNEATKHVAEPLQKYQTEPKNKAQQEQQRKPKGPKV